MKKVLLIISVFCFPLGLRAVDIEPIHTDTTIVVDGKRVEIKDGADRMKVRVYKIADDGREIADEMVFEGHYADGKSYESRKRSINLPIPHWNRDFSGHWDGVGMGFANFADGNFHFNDIDGVSLRSGNSLEYNLNALEKGFPLSRRGNFALVTGMGMRWSRYRLDGNCYFKEVDGITLLHPAPEGIYYTAAKLNITSLTIPLLLEWQNKQGRFDNIFISAGVTGVIKTASSSRVAYRNESGKKLADKMDGGMNIRPVTMDFLFQAGYDWIGIYARYSPMGLFEKTKGPKIHPVSIGLHLHL
ncbi:MAG: PorT family protein [Tannerellaceae bacterium]|jgi:hypothetical protein|nr:PorT family protein [Tannerellaceae bacterium]